MCLIIESGYSIQNRWHFFSCCSNLEEPGQNHGKYKRKSSWNDNGIKKQKKNNKYPPQKKPTEKQHKTKKTKG